MCEVGDSGRRRKPRDLPSSDVLAWQDVDDPASNNVTLPIFVFEPRPSLIAGRIYHLVFRNVTGQESPVCSCSGSECNPAENYVSVGQINTPDGCDPQQPTISEMDLATLISGDDGQTWSKNCFHTPVFSIWYDDQTQSGQGVGYLGARSGTPRSIVGLAKVRERFQVPAGRVTSVWVSELSLRVRRTSENPTDLRVRLLEVIEGMRYELFSSEIRPSDISQTMTWITVKFPSPILLRNDANKSYQFILESDQISHETYGLRDGGESVMHPASTFTNGIMEFTVEGDEGLWCDNRNATRCGGANNDSVSTDLQFYFTVVTDR